jgi:hypothetical protein
MSDTPYGLIAEFQSAAQLLSAAQQARQEGYRKLEGYSPVPVEGLAEELGLTKTSMPAVVLAGGILGCVTGYLMQYWISAVDYPINVGGRPLHSWPSFIPVTFELTILFGAIFAFAGMLALNGLPMPYHPVFNAPRFTLSGKDRFFLCIEATDPLFDREATSRFLAYLGAKEVTLVEP